MYILDSRDVGETHQAETEASGDETEASVNRSMASPPRCRRSRVRLDQVVSNNMFRWTCVSEMIHQAVVHEASSVETEASVNWSEARRWKVSRWPRDRGYIPAG
jgi:hypothetical protein